MGFFITFLTFDFREIAQIFKGGRFFKTQRDSEFFKSYLSENCKSILENFAKYSFAASLKTPEDLISNISKTETNHDILK